MLHFHGRSTWGIETRKQMEERNKKYTEVFLKKWGHDMTQILILRNNFSNIFNRYSSTEPKIKSENCPPRDWRGTFATVTNRDLPEYLSNAQSPV